MVYASDGRLVRVPESAAVIAIRHAGRKGGPDHRGAAVTSRCIPPTSVRVSPTRRSAAISSRPLPGPHPERHPCRAPRPWVLYVYGNYAGDNMNFDIAAEMAADEGIEVATVRVIDDVAAMPPSRMDERRGIGGAFFQVKVAGAACSEASTLAEATRW